jgi:micrococcal nuclease
MPLGVVLACIIIGISDGDTMTARCETVVGMENIRVRLAEIDAPETGQAFGERSKQHLADLCFLRGAAIMPRTKDRYLRTVAEVSCEGIDAGKEQIRSGMAWVFDRYATNRKLYAIQDEARSERRGLWMDSNPIRPWDWRKANPMPSARSP